MESQLQRPSHGHRRFGQDPQHAGLHSVIEGEGDEEQHEHKSVLKKVKDKAKKIKDKISKHQHQQGEEEEDDDDDEEAEEEEVVNDPEVHGAPMYETTVIRSIDVPAKTSTDEARHVETGPTAPEPRGPVEQRPTRHDAEEPKMKIGPLMGLEEDPHSPYNSPPASNYQSKVSDPTGAGGKEADVSPLVRQLGKLNVGELDRRPDKEKSVSCQQFAPHLDTQEKISTGPEKTHVPAGDTIGGKISEYAEKVAETLDPVYQKLRPGDDHTAEKNESSGEGVIERVKDAVGSWLGRPHDSAHLSGSSREEGLEGKS
ncbi:Unknown protein [Striga hermonthica]|uniref:Low-temperature-induced 65 kDa protein-like n=1 Tax=Striga hermonthica TaxID=68872 RepID=A0A9N7NB64_STRHE|nr:Unknown protein [Striga hermonthica]